MSPSSPAMKIADGAKIGVECETRTICWEGVRRRTCIRCTLHFFSGTSLSATNATETGLRLVSATRPTKVRASQPVLAKQGNEIRLHELQGFSEPGRNLTGFPARLRGMRPIRTQEDVHIKEESSQGETTFSCYSHRRRSR